MDGTADAAPRDPRRPPAVQLGFLWGAAAVFSAGLVFLAPGLLARARSTLPHCPVKALAGVPCPACGSGRALVALSRLHVAAALRLNPLFSAAALALALAGRGVPEPRALPLAVRVAAVLGVAANWAFLLLDVR